MRFDLSVVFQYWPYLLLGTWLTLQLTVLGTLIGLVLGLAAALAKMSRHPLLRAPAEFYIWFIRGTPLLVQLFLIYYGLPQIGIDIPAYWAGVAGLGINVGAYIAEVYRASLLAVPRGQTEAALSLGMTPALTLYRIVLPQALKIAMPSLGNQAIILLKDSSLASTITISEVLMVSKRFGSVHFAYVEFFVVAAVIYLILTSFFTTIVGWAERALSAGQPTPNGRRDPSRAAGRVGATWRSPGTSWLRSTRAALSAQMPASTSGEHVPPGDG